MTSSAQPAGLKYILAVWMLLADLGFGDDMPSTRLHTVKIAPDGTQYILAIRMLMADLNLGAAAGPTPFYTDSKIVLDGLACDKLVKSSRWLAARYAMLRYGAENHLIAPRFVGAEDNVADLLTKPLTGETFIRLRRIALGTA